jgi:hypothetical protein
MTKPSVDDALNAALLVGCAYEIVALVSPLPTITHILKRLGRRHPLGKATLWLWCGFVAWHFLEPDEVS